MSRGFYEQYWNRPDPLPLADPLAQRRLRILQETMSSEKANVPRRRLGGERPRRGFARTGDAAVGMDISSRAVSVAASCHESARFIAYSAEDLPWPARVIRRGGGL